MENRSLLGRYQIHYNTQYQGAYQEYQPYEIIKPITQQNKLTLLARLSAVDLQRTPSFYTLDVIANYYNLKKILVDYDQIQNIFCVFNTIILSSTPSVITKTQFNQRKQLFRINAYQSNDKRINNISIDYNRSLNIIASGSSDKTIKLWNGNDGSLLMEKQNAYKFQVGDYLINQIIFWDINFQEKQLEKKILIKDQITGLSLVLNQQYIITQFNFIKVYSITGKLIRIFDHEFYPTVRLNGLIQIESMKSVLVEGNSKYWFARQNQIDYFKQLKNNIKFSEIKVIFLQFYKNKQFQALLLKNNENI